MSTRVSPCITYSVFTHVIVSSEITRRYGREGPTSKHTIVPMPVSTPVRMRPLRPWNTSLARLSRIFIVIVNSGGCRCSSGKGEVEVAMAEIRARITEYVDDCVLC